MPSKTFLARFSLRFEGFHPQNRIQFHLNLSQKFKNQSCWQFNSTFGNLNLNLDPYLNSAFVPSLYKSHLLKFLLPGLMSAGILWLSFEAFILAKEKNKFLNRQSLKRGNFTYTASNLLFDRVDNPVNAFPVVFVLSTSSNDAEALKNIYNIVDSAPLDP